MALTDSLTAYWKLDETSGTRYDETANNVDLTDNNTVLYGAGKIGNSADFESANTEYLSNAGTGTTPMDITGDMTFSAWINLESLPSAGAYSMSPGTFLSKYSSASNQRAYWFAYGRDSGGTLSYMAINSNDGSATSIGSVNRTLSTGTWYHVVYVYDASAGTIDVYENGSSVGQMTSMKTSVYNNDIDFQLGACSQQTSYFDGLMADVGIWSRTLTGAEITSLYNSGSGLTYPFTGAPADIKNDSALSTSLSAYWKLDETSGTRYDETANNNDLTDNNTVLYGTGKLGNGADFEKDNSEYLSIVDASTTGLDGTAGGAMSFSWWMNLESLAADQAIINKITALQPGYRIMVVYSGGGSYILAGWWNTGSGLNRAQTAAGTVTSGSLDHWVCTMDFSTGSAGILLYKNGSVLSMTSSNNDGGSMGNSTEKFSIGCLNADSTPITFFDGIIDEVGVWTRKLTPDEVAYIYNAGSGLPYEAASGPANLKTWNGIAKASLKTWNGVAIASLKSWNGIV